MAHKYDLLLVKTQTDEKKRYKPWYRERLETKYVKPRKTRGKSDTLIGSQWTFLQQGSDDFRDGLPPEAFYNYVKRDDLGFGPTITGSQHSINRNQRPKKFTKTEAIYSKALPLQQQRREHVEDIEFNLTQHPLALFPHLEESLAPDVFEDVVEVLDPEMNIDSDAEEDSFEESPPPSAVGSEKQPSVRESQSAKSMESGQRSELGEKGKAAYRWLPKQEDIQKEERMKASRKKPDSPTSDTQIQDVTREFCNWVAGLGSHKYTPSWVKVKYGAWYLNPKTWKPRSKDEPLQDPKEQQDKTLSESKKKSQKL
ncbi:hypothetical protein QZH41_009835, partial [Actinostola sp. cb2023]